MYFTNSRYVSRGNALLPVEQAAQLRVQRNVQKIKGSKKSKKKVSKKTKVSNIKAKDSTLVDARKSKGNVNAINIKISDQNPNKINFFLQVLQI